SHHPMKQYVAVSKESSPDPQQNRNIKSSIKNNLVVDGISVSFVANRKPNQKFISNQNTKKVKNRSNREETILHFLLNCFLAMKNYLIDSHIEQTENIAPKNTLD
ncbi:hypothetical protein JTB14_009045, partial [Gonioctena quinquepunctata]